MMMKILDRYLLKQFLQTLLFGLLAFTLMFIVIDMMENLDDFIDQNVPNNLIVEYYFVFAPEIIRLMTPIAVLLSSLFTAGKMSNQNELTAIRSSGVSIYRFMLPFLAMALFISVFTIFFGGYVVPEANQQKVFIEQTYMKKGIEQTGNNIFFQDTRTRIVSISFYDALANQAHRISIQEFDPEDVTEMVSRIEAARMSFDTTSSSWILTKGIQRRFIGKGEIAERFDTLKIDYLNFEPEDVVKKQMKPEEMTLTELRHFANEQLEAGNDPTRILIEYHSRIAFAFASFVVVLFGLPLSANKRRGGLALQFGINILITFVYLVFMQISQAFGKNGVLNPILTAWLANIFFLIAAIVNLMRVEK